MNLGFIKNMTKRERFAVCFAAGAIGLFLVYQLIITPYVNNNKTLERQYAQKAKDLQEMLALKSEYEASSKSLDLSKLNFQNREKGFTLFSFLDKLAGETGVKDNVNYMKPSSSDSKSGAYKISQVELKLKSINLKQLTEYLYGIETSKNVIFVKRLTIDQSSQPEGYIDVVMQVETYEMVQTQDQLIK